MTEPDPAKLTAPPEDRVATWPAMVSIESRGSLVAVVPASGPGLLVTPMRCRYRLVAGGETLDPQYQPGDLRIRGLAEDEPAVTFTEFLAHDHPPEVLSFIQRHELFDLVYTIVGTPIGSVDRRLVVVGCSLAAVDLIESDEVRLHYTLTGERVEGDLLAFIGLG